MATKTEYLEEIETRLGEMEAQLEGLMAQATHSDYAEYLTDIRTKQEIAKAKLAGLKQASDEDWHGIKTEIEKAVSDVQNALFVATADSR